VDLSRDDPPRLPNRPFAEFYAEHKAELLRFAWHYGAPHLDLEAIVAETWARAYASWQAIDRPRPWLYRVLMNLIHDAGKAAQQTRPAQDPFPAGNRVPVWNSAVPLPGPDWAARVSEIGQALQRLPAQQRAAVLLDYQGFSRTEIAAALGCTTITVRGHLHRGRGSLKNMLGELDPSTQEPQRAPGLEGRPA
jgi:RNA polymerase sigma factor (sigma-70 family)